MKTNSKLIVRVLLDAINSNGPTHVLSPRIVAGSLPRLLASNFTGHSTKINLVENSEVKFGEEKIRLETPRPLYLYLFVKKLRRYSEVFFFLFAKLFPSLVVLQKAATRSKLFPNGQHIPTPPLPLVVYIYTLLRLLFHQWIRNLRCWGSRGSSRGCGARSSPTTGAAGVSSRGSPDYLLGTRGPRSSLTSPMRSCGWAPTSPGPPLWSRPASTMACRSGQRV